MDGESRRGRGPLSAWGVSFATTVNPSQLEATVNPKQFNPAGHELSPASPEYDSNDAARSVLCLDRVELNEDQRGLAIRYLPMAHQLAQRLCAIWPGDRQELESTAYLALAKAAQLFDSSRKVGFGTFARHRIRAALRDLQRLLSVDGRPGRDQRGLARSELCRFQDRIGREIGIEPDQSRGPWIETADAVDDWLRRLPKAHASVCRFIYREGKSEDEVAAQLGCSTSTLVRMHREAITGLIRDHHRARLGHRPDSAKPTD